MLSRLATRWRPTPQLVPNALGRLGGAAGVHTRPPTPVLLRTALSPSRGCTAGGSSGSSSSSSSSMFGTGSSSRLSFSSSSGGGGGMLSAVASAATRRNSSSLAGLERAGLPRLERDSKGRATGPKKGGKGRRALGGVIAIKNTWNNTLISISNSSYKQLGFVSGGSVGFKKSKRSSQFATEKTISEAFAKARSVGIRKVMLALSGPAISLRKPLFKSIRDESGIRIMKLKMNDNVPHGGCRPRKSRRRRWKTKARR